MCVAFNSLFAIFVKNRNSILFFKRWILFTYDFFVRIVHNLTSEKGMKPKKLRKLVLKKEVVSLLNEESQKQIVGGVSETITMGCCMETANFACLTKGTCDLPTIGHDDGDNCISKELSICYGIG